MSANFVMIW